MPISGQKSQNQHNKRDEFSFLYTPISFQFQQTYSLIGRLTQNITEWAKFYSWFVDHFWEMSYLLCGHHIASNLKTEYSNVSIKNGANKWNLLINSGKSNQGIIACGLPAM